MAREYCDSFRQCTTRNRFDGCANCPDFNAKKYIAIDKEGFCCGVEDSMKNASVWTAEVEDPVFLSIVQRAREAHCNHCDKRKRFSMKQIAACPAIDFEKIKAEVIAENGGLNYLKYQ